jgi:two-component system KDP operon response regulator KdpE
MDVPEGQQRLLRMRSIDKRWAATTAPTVLVVDDSADELQQTHARLQSVGLNPRPFTRGGSALIELGKGDSDAVVLSASPGGISCTDWVSAAREASTIPILVGLREEHLGRIGAILAAGATAVVGYPFDPVEVADELEWTWETVAVRGASRGHLQVGPLELDAPSFSARIDGQELRLTFGAFELLWCLMLRANRVVRPDEISRSLGRPEGSSAAASYAKTQVAKLRAELGDRTLVQTVRGQGYTVRHLLPLDRPSTTEITRRGRHQTAQRSPDRRADRPEPEARPTSPRR